MRRRVLCFTCVACLAITTLAVAGEAGKAPAPAADSQPATAVAGPAATVPAVPIPFLEQGGRCPTPPGRSLALGSPALDTAFFFDPGGCGNCGITCRSEPGCLNRLPGDACNDTGGTCQIFNVCDLTNCCRCL